MTSKFPLPPGVELRPLLETLRSLSWGAADILIAYARGEQPPFGFSRSFNIDNSGKGPVSSADLAVNTLLLEGFSSKYKGIDWNVLSEESSASDFHRETISSSDWLWLIDPLDGTKDFIQGTGDYAMQLGLLYKGSPVFGVVLIPESGELWFGGIGIGSWCENREGRKIDYAFGERRELSEMIIIASRNHRDKRLEDLLGGIKFGGKITKGSVGCKIITILKGETDFYVSLSGETAPKDWDMAGPQALLLSAGGNFTHANGKALAYKSEDFSQKGCLVASNGKNHQLICDVLSERIFNLELDLSI